MTAILVIDDHAGTRKTIERILTGAGYEVLVAEDGRRGLEVYSSQLPPLVITDILMPEKDGMQIVRELKRLGSPPKILAISGGAPFGERSILEWAQERGADAVARKPLRAAELLSLVNDLLSPA